MPRTCSECGAPIGTRSKQAKTCSDKCSDARSYRLKKGEPDPVKPLKDAVNNNNSEIQRAVRDELRAQVGPVVRSALTEDALRAVEGLVGLAPQAIERLQAQVLSDDDKISQGAISLLLRYTVGHNALITPEATEPNQQMVVNFNLPRPAESDFIEATATEDIPDTTRTCDVCNIEQPIANFVANSDRCQDCFSKAKAEILERFLN